MMTPDEVREIEKWAQDCDGGSPNDCMLGAEYIRRLVAEVVELRAALAHFYDGCDEMPSHRGGVAEYEQCPHCKRNPETTRSINRRAWLGHAEPEPEPDEDQDE